MWNVGGHFLAGPETKASLPPHSSALSAEALVPSASAKCHFTTQQVSTLRRECHFQTWWE